ncbi:MAG: response regulator [Betaproteobacteria bacterium]|nr:response regulator [Betaproteobacteria bacterium]
MKIRVILADDHRIILAALSSLLARTADIEVIGEATSGAELLEMLTRMQPDIVVTDIAMPGMTGLEAARRIAEIDPDLPVLALSGHTDKHFVLGMFNAGVRGYLVKSAAGDELPRAIRAVAAGDTYLSGEVAGALAEGVRAGHTAERAGPRLGPRELQVLTLLAAGKSSKLIAMELQISPATVEVHRRNIMRKLDLHSVAELTKYAVREGLTDP